MRSIKLRVALVIGWVTARPEGVVKKQQLRIMESESDRQDIH